VWILLGMSAIVLACWREQVVMHIRALGPVALPVIAALLFSLVLSVHPWQGATVFRDLIKALVVALALAILAQQASSAWLKWLKHGITLCTIAAGLLALWLIYTPSHSAMVITWCNSVENMNLWGLSFALLLSCSIAVALNNLGSRHKQEKLSALFMLLAAAILFTWLSLSYPSRGALLAALCSSALLLLLRFTRISLMWLFIASASAFIVGSLAVLIIRAGGWISAAELNTISSNRLPIYDTVWSLWQQAPWFGWGLKAFKTHAAVEIASNMGGHSFTAPHNILLEMLYSMGVIGSTLLMVALGRILWLAMQAAQSTANPLVGLLATAIIITLMLHGATDLSIYRPYFFLLVFSAWGLVQGSDERNGPYIKP